MTGFKYALELADGDAADPVFFNSALPPETWKPGDEFLAASDLRRFRSRAIDFEAAGVVAGHADAIWMVAPSP